MMAIPPDLARFYVLRVPTGAKGRGVAAAALLPQVAITWTSVRNAAWRRRIDGVFRPLTRSCGARTSPKPSGNRRGKRWPPISKPSLPAGRPDHVRRPGTGSEQFRGCLPDQSLTGAIGKDASTDSVAAPST